MRTVGPRSPGPGDLAFGGLLSVLAAASSAGLTGSNTGDPRSGILAAVLVLTMVAPVVLARRLPVETAIAIGAGAALNWLAIGHLVRCGAALPAVFYVAFVIGMHRLTWPRLALGAAALTVDLVCQAVSDPELGAGVLVYMIPISLGFGAAGRLWRRRRADVARLREETARLREQRDTNARLAVAADRARIAADFGGFLGDGVEQIAAAAAQGRDRLDDDPERARQAFVDIQRTGRDALTRMRDALADLGGEPLAVAGEMLPRLDRLVSRATEGRSSLLVEGDARLLPPSLELSAYRIVERLLTAVEDRSSAGRPHVVVGFDRGELRLTVTGGGVQPSTERAAVAVAKERAAVHGGTVQTSLQHGRRTTVVRLPVAVGRV